MFDLFTKKRGNWKDDVLSGLTVALALVPEAIAFSFLAGVPPVVGLWSAVFLGFIASAFGGRPGMISGATGAIAVVVAAAYKYGQAQGLELGLGAEAAKGLGMQYIFATVMIAGGIQILFGVLKLGRFIRLVPHPVMMGFVNGLAIVILMAQFGSFKTAGDAPAWLPQNELVLMGCLVVLTMAIIQFFPKITKTVPSTLVAILVVGGLSFFWLDSRTISNVLLEGDPASGGILKGAFHPSRCLRTSFGVGQI